jgi:enolase
MLKAFTDGIETWIAKDKNDLVELLMDEYGYASIEDLKDERDLEDFKELSSDKELDIQIEEDEGWVEKKKTVAEWIKLIGRGFLSSTEI